MKICPECCDKPYQDQIMVCPTCGTTLSLVERKDKKAEKKEKKKERPKISIRVVLYSIIAVFVFAGSVGSLLYFLFYTPPDNTLDNGVSLTTPGATGEAIPSVIPAFVDPEQMAFEDRYFTHLNFSFVMETDLFAGRDFFFTEDIADGKTSYQNLELEMVARLADPQCIIHSNSTLYARVMAMANAYSDQVYHTVQGDYADWHSFLEAMITVEEETFSVDSYVIHHTTLVFQLAQAEGEEAPDTAVAPFRIEIFRLPYPEMGGEYFELCVVGGETPLDSGEYLPLFTTMLTTIVSNESLMEYYENGMAKYTTFSFSAQYNPVQTTDYLIPYPLAQETEQPYQQIHLAFVDEILAESCYLELRFTQDTTEYPKETVGTESFELMKTTVQVSESETASLLYGVRHTGAMGKTQISLSLTEAELQQMSFTQSDVDLIEQFLSQMMETYTPLSP